MNYNTALKADIGDRLIAMYNTSIWNKNDELIIIEKSTICNSTEATFYHKRLNKICGGNIQSFVFKNN